MKRLSKKRKPSPDLVKESNSIGADAGDATSGVPESPEEWASEQPLAEDPTHALEPGDPTPFQPAAGTPEAETSEAPLPEECEARGRP